MYFFYTNNAVLFGCTIRWKTLLSACWRVHNQNKFVFILWQVCSKEGQDTLLFACICTIHYSRIIRTRNKERSIFTPSLLRFLDHVYLCIIEKNDHAMRQYWYSFSAIGNVLLIHVLFSGYFSCWQQIKIKHREF